MCLGCDAGGSTIQQSNYPPSPTVVLVFPMYPRKTGKQKKCKKNN